MITDKKRTYFLAAFLLLRIISAEEDKRVNDLISRESVLDALERERAGKSVIGAIKSIPSVQQRQIFTKTEYIMCLHNEYGCNLRDAERAHEKALEYLQNKVKVKG